MNIPKGKELLIQSAGRFSELEQVIIDFHETRLRHFIQRFKERFGLNITIYDCLNAEAKIRLGAGQYLRQEKRNESERREVRAIVIRKRKVVVVYNMDTFSMITCMRLSQEVKDQVLKCNFSSFT